MTNLSATPINHGRIAYLCSFQTSTNTFCTNKASVVTEKTSTSSGMPVVLCNEHWKA